MRKGRVHTGEEEKLPIELVGGLGNQLFGYFFGLFISNKLGMEPRFLLTHSKLTKKRPSSITEFDLPFSIEHRSIGTLDFVRARKAMYHLLRRMGLSRVGAESISRVHFSDEIGKDSSSDLILSGQLVVGYFQSREYFFAVKEKGIFQPLELANPSNWFSSLDALANELRPIVVHVRRGDYKAQENRQIGLLGESYFLNGLQNLRSVPGLKNRPIWMFTDAAEDIQTSLPNLLSEVDLWVQPPAESSPAESLILMSRGAGIVISNSTFSWWAATLGEIPHVVAPSSWFRDLPEPEGLISENWVRTLSHWD